MSDIPYTVTLVAALGSGLNAGVLFAFSSFVMPALKRLPAPQGIAAMQSINILAVTFMFMSVFFGTALVSLGLGGWAIFASGDQPVALLVGGAAAYVIGTFGMTVVGNVPLNNRLAVADANAASSVALWEDYVTRWTNLNHIRTLTSLIAAAFFIIALNA